MMVKGSEDISSTWLGPTVSKKELYCYSARVYYMIYVDLLDMP